jgi:ribosomal protein L37AE/L43A
MDSTFTCDWCGQKIAIDKRSDAVIVKCPKCGKSLMVPPMSIPTRTPQTATANPAKLTPSGGASPATHSASQTKLCPFCAKPMGQEAEVCRFCGYTPVSWNPQGTVEKELTMKRGVPTVVFKVLAFVAIVLLGIIIYTLMTTARS